MKKKFNILIIISLILGIILGIYLPNVAKNISFLGTIYVNLLKFMIIPIVFTSITVSIYNSMKLKTKTHLLLKTILIFTIMFISTFVLTSIIVAILNPASSYKYDIILWQGELTKFNISDIITNLFPNNFITMIENNAVFPTIIFSVICGIASSKINKGPSVINIIGSFKELFNKILEYIMYLTPIGVFSLISTTIANYGTSIISLGAKYIGVAYLCSVIALIFVMILPVCLITKINPFTYIKKISKVWLITMTTCSSSATLPYTIKVCNEDLEISDKVTDMVVPLGCTIHMCGGAVSFALLGLFCSHLFGITIDIPTYLLMLVSATLINMAAPGIPNGGIAIGATYISLLGIPLTFIGFYSGIYKVLDMIYTTLNVTGDISANVIINHSLDKKKSM